jgi:mono/diheme cytochrome c family protein
MKRNILSEIPGRVFQLLIPALALGLLMSSMSGAQAPAPATETQAAAVLRPGNAENGKKLYATYYCWACHGSLGRAGGAAPAITPSTRTDMELITYLRKPAGNMPPYTSKVISEQELADIAAYMRSIPSGTPDPKTIPLLQEINK